MLGGRSVAFVVREALERDNYASLARVFKTCKHPIDFVWRYLAGAGRYPARTALRTPLGVVAPTSYTHHDIWTVSEVFCRLDYRLPDNARTVVDIGSNIGISALFFLTRSRDVRCFLFEPDPRNAARLEANLEGYEDRYSLARDAVADFSGPTQFGREPTGRYGGIGLELADVIDVSCRHINDVLTEVIAAEGQIDMLKIDTEGMEHRTVAAIDHDILDRVRVICYEASSPTNPAPELFDMSFAVSTVRLTNRRVWE